MSFFLLFRLSLDYHYFFTTRPTLLTFLHAYENYRLDWVFLQFSFSFWGVPGSDCLGGNFDVPAQRDLFFFFALWKSCVTLRDRGCDGKQTDRVKNRTGQMGIMVERSKQQAEERDMDWWNGHSRQKKAMEGGLASKHRVSGLAWSGLVW